MKEKIKELLSSSDKEIRLLGLSYLNCNKDKNSIIIYHTYSWKKNFREWSKYPPKAGWYDIIPLKRITDRLEIGRVPPSLLDIYLDYCYDSGRD